MYKNICLVSPALTNEEAFQIRNRLINQTWRTRWLRPSPYDEDYLHGQVADARGVTASVELREVRMTRYLPSENDYLLLAGTGRRPWIEVKWEASEPYITVNASVNKLMLGNDILEGPRQFLPATAWLVDHLSERLGFPLPSFLEWSVKRINYTETWNLSPEANSDILASVPQNTLGRHPATMRRGTEYVYLHGATTYVSIYQVCPALIRRDASRLRSYLTEAEFQDLQENAYGKLRVESKITAGRLCPDLGLRDRYPLVSEIYDEHIQAIHNDDLYRLCGEGRFGSFPVVRHPDSVRNRLNQEYGKRLARNLFRTWERLVEEGRRTARKHLSPRTFSEHQKKLIGAGCGWLGSITHTESYRVPDGFSMCRSDSRCCRDEDPRIVEMLIPYRANS